MAITAATTMLTAFVPSATAAGQSTGAVASARSFRVESAKRNLFQEAVSTTAGGSKKWTLADSTTSTINVPKTKSNAEIEADVKAQQEREAAAQRAAAAQQQAASRSEDRESLTSTNQNSTSVTVSAPNSATAASVISYAKSFVGVAPYVYGGNTPSGWDCSGFVQYVFASVGIGLAHSSGAQAGAGRAVSSLAQAEPGDILANSTHAAIYIGNGMVVNALNESAGTTYSSVGIAFSGGYSIRRVL